MRLRLFRHVARMSIVVLLVAGTVPQMLQAQRMPMAAGVTHQASLAFGNQLDQAAPKLALPRVADGEKDPLIAGLLSLILPGAGSFYAGNTPHGVRHVVIEVASYAVLFGACNPGSTSTNNCGAALGLSYVALLGNTAWAIVTAVNDAHATVSSSPKKGSE